MKKPKKLPFDHAYAIANALEMIREVSLEKRKTITIRQMNRILKTETERYLELSGPIGTPVRHYEEITNDHLLRPKPRVSAN